MVSLCRALSVGNVTAQDAIDHSTGNATITGASIVAVTITVARAVAGAAVVDRSTAITAAVAAAVAAAITATVAATMTTAGSSDMTAAARMGSRRMSGVTVGGSQCIRWQATNGEGGSERASDKCLMKHASLLI